MADRSRQKREPRHVRLYHTITGSEAWKHLSGNAIKVLIALARYDDGSSNGNLYFSERTGAKATGLSRNTVKRCLAELIEKGFVAQTKPGAFNRNNLLAATYRLTWVAAPGCKPSAPTRDFEKWKHGNSQAQFLTPSGSNSDTCMETPTKGGPIPDSSETETSHVSSFPGGSKYGPQVLYQGDRRSDPETEQRKQANSISGAFLAELRASLIASISEGQPGEQTRLASRLNIPGGTLSKFRNGGTLPPCHVQSLASALRIAVPV